MAFEMKNLSGSLFNNDRKEKETHPDLQGSCMIDGQKYYMSGWKKQGQGGEWISISLKPAEAKKDTTALPIAAAPAQEIDEETIPF